MSARVSTAGFRRLAGTAAVAGPIVFTAAWLLAWVVQDHYSPRREDISALAALDAQHPWLMVIGFLALGLGTLALGIGLVSSLAGNLSTRIGALLVIIAGLGIVTAGLARNDCSSELAACTARVDAGLVSSHHQAHDAVSAVLFLALVAAQLVLARAFGREAEWRDLWRYSIVSGMLTFALLVLFGSGVIAGWNGLVQRVFVAVPWLWIAVLGHRLRRLTLPGRSHGEQRRLCANPSRSRTALSRARTYVRASWTAGACRPMASPVGVNGDYTRPVEPDEALAALDSLDS